MRQHIDLAARRRRSYGAGARQEGFFYVATMFLLCLCGSNNSFSLNRDHRVNNHTCKEAV